MERSKNLYGHKLRMSQQCCSGTKKENLLSACTNLHIAISKEAKHTDLKVGP